MAERNYYVLKTVVDIAQKVERLVFHGPYDDGFTMETTIEDEALAKDANILERLVVVDNEIQRLNGPFRPGQDDKSLFTRGKPENPGLYWVVMRGRKAFIIEVHDSRSATFYGSADTIDMDCIVSYKSIQVPVLTVGDY